MLAYYMSILKKSGQIWIQTLIKTSKSKKMIYIEEEKISLRGT